MRSVHKDWVTAKMRMPEEVYTSLLIAAQRNLRTPNDEAVHRLELSLRRKAKSSVQVAEKPPQAAA
jgi:hypothetical protein